MKELSKMTLEELKRLEFEAEPYGYRIVEELIRRIELLEFMMRRNYHE